MNFASQGKNQTKQKQKQKQKQNMNHFQKQEMIHIEETNQITKPCYVYEEIDFLASIILEGAISSIFNFLKFRLIICIIFERKDHDFWKLKTFI